MGFLHEGHLSLMRGAKKRSDAVAVSIFVNPTQFGPKEDLSRYPRDLAGDLAKCEQIGVEMVFAPSAAELYPPGFQTFVEVGQVSQRLCGERRPGHFRGVATVVAKLFALLRPDIAFFGEKDYQQLLVIQTLSRDLNFGVEVVGLPTVREPDGLALSSRNSHLTPEERERAAALWRGIRAAQALFAAGEKDASKLAEAAAASLRERQLRQDYVEVVDAQTLEPLAEVLSGPSARVLLAAFAGNTRLIDNAPLG
jgi:pantoate--beta-alanine ligase